jgi:hypothetical protein
LTEARRLYNLGQYEAAERLAREAVESPAQADAARVVIGRIQLERFRESGANEDLDSARESLRLVDPRGLDVEERVELTIGLAEALYFERRYSAAADLFDSVLHRSVVLGHPAHERVLDWWATSLDRYAQGLPPEQRASTYDRVTERMRQEIADYPESTAAAYWLAASARAAEDLERAWQAAMAGWVRAVLADDRGAALRADLDRLVVKGIIPDRAARLPGRPDPKQAETGMLAEWEAFKSAWSK